MKQINKHASPLAFENWKQQYRSGSGLTLSKLYTTSISGNDLWGNLPSSPIRADRMEEGVAYFSKKELRTSIIEEQGSICCYCNQSVENNSTSILEHFHPKGLEKYKNQTFDYQNILISCNGGQRDPRPRDLHCDANRNEGEELLLSPLQEDIEDHFDFTVDGQILSLTEDAKEVIEKLGLTIDKLERLRESAIRSYIYENPFEENILNLKFISKEAASKEIKRLQLQNKKRFEPFCMAIIKVLENEILNIT